MPNRQLYWKPPLTCVIVHYKNYYAVLVSCQWANITKSNHKLSIQNMFSSQTRRPNVASTLTTEDVFFSFINKQSCFQLCLKRSVNPKSGSFICWAFVGLWEWQPISPLPYNRFYNYVFDNNCESGPCVIELNK